MQNISSVIQYALNGVALSIIGLSAALASPGFKSAPSPLTIDSATSCSNEKLAPGADIGMWVWRESSVADPQNREDLIKFCQRFGISRIFVQVRFHEVDDGYQFARADDWNELLKSANAAGIKVEALDGAGFMGFDEHRADTIKRLDAVITFNESQPSDAKLSGFHYDIEPYVTDRWKQGDQQQIAIELLETMDQLRQKVKSSDPSLTIAHDIPFWYSGRENLKVSYNGSEKYLDEHVQDLSDFIGIMSYRTHMTGSNSVSAVAQQEVDYAGQTGGLTYLSLETVPLEETPSITFHGKDPAKFAMAIRELNDHMKDQAGYGGIFIHCYRTARPMLEEWAEAKKQAATN